MNLINKLFFTLCLSLLTTFAYGDTANDILNRLTDKISSIIENTLGGDTEFSLEFPEDDDVELEILKFKELDNSDGQNSFSQISLHISLQMKSIPIELCLLNIQVLFL